MAPPVWIWTGVSVLLVLADYIPTAEARIGKFWHVTDFHFDLNYTTFGLPDNMCWKPRNYSYIRKSKDQEMAKNVGEFGDYSCDAPLSLLTSAVDAMTKFENNPDFILWTGDDTAHISDDNFSTELVVEIITNLTYLITSRFPNTPIFPVLGNHDYYPKNQMPVGPNPLQSLVAEVWRTYFDDLGEDVYSSFNLSGRYWADVPDSSVTIVAINTLIWYKSNNNTALLSDTDPGALDPDDQFSWLEEILYDLANRNRRVYLVGHIPPGTFERYQQKREGFHWYQSRYNERFIKLVQKYFSVIEAQFFAHHHTDSFRLVFEEEKQEKPEERIPVSYLLLSPGVTPWRSTLSKETGANNPGIRLVSYDTKTGIVLDISTYYLNLTAANLNGRAQWQLEYNFSSTYNLSSLNPHSLYEVAKTLKRDSTIFDRYYRANTVSLEDPKVCATRCRLLHWCSITELKYNRFYDCNNSPSHNSSRWPFLVLAFLSLLMTR